MKFFHRICDSESARILHVLKRLMLQFAFAVSWLESAECLPAQDDSGQPRPPAAKDNFLPRTVIPRAFPAIKDAPFISRESADKLLSDSELVLGVVVNGQARAYPINMLTGPRREIINDQLGASFIAATW